MRILADENMPAVTSLFGDVATEIRTLPGRALRPEDVAAADVLLVRSVTPVNADLLNAAHALKFVGSATIGTDHVDQALLQQRGIPFAWAPGCNAVGVVDFVLGALLALHSEDPAALRHQRVAVVGAGQVGGRLVSRLRALGLSVVVCDPPREAQNLPGPEGEPETAYVSLEEAFSADILCCHAPLTTTDPWPTRHMISNELLQRLPPGAVFLNAGRGGVVASDDLRQALAVRPDLRLVLDVWEPEPELPLDLLAACRLATGHIAGYSLEGRLRGTWMLRQVLGEALGLAPPAQAVTDLLPSAPALTLQAAEQPEDPWQVLHHAVMAVCDPLGDDQRFRQAIGAVPPAERGQAFDAWRREYAGRENPRRELGSVPVVHEGLGDDALDLLRRAGFQGL